MVDRTTKHLQQISQSDEDDIISLEVQTNSSKLVVAMAAKHSLITEEEKKLQVKNIVAPDYVEQTMSSQVDQGETINFQKVVALYTSRDDAVFEPLSAARQAVKDAPHFHALLNTQITMWRNLWRQFDLFIDTSEAQSKLLPSMLLHFNSFHVMQTASRNIVDLDVGMPARGWTGEGYEGHVFWDDLFIFPFINMRMPSVSRALLKYRYRRLDEARKLAHSLGARGARFPWQSGSDGREETQSLWLATKHKWVKDATHNQIHVNAAIAYNIWQYFQVTNDLDFMHSFGSEMLFEIARFFATYAQYNEERQRFEIHGVVGPDEYHTGYPNAKEPGINNNAYTNIMAVWCIWRALEWLNKMPSDHRLHIREKLNLTDQETSLWNRVSRQMYVPFINDDLISQYEGYEKLEEFPYRKEGKLDLEKVEQVLADQGANINEYKVSKQADVLMLFYVFSTEELSELFERIDYKFSPDMINQAIDYYLPRTANLSTLSRVALAWVLSRLNRKAAWKFLSTKEKKQLWPLQGEKEPVEGSGGHNGEHPLKSYDIFLEALSSDFTSVGHGTTGEGVHLAAMAGAIDIVQRCYTGIVTRGDVLWLSPCLPEVMSRLSFSLIYRDQALTFDITQKTLRVTARHSSASAIKIGFEGRVHKLESGGSQEFKLKR